MEVFMSRSPVSAEVHSFLHDRLDAMLEESNKVMDNSAFGQTVHDLDDLLFDAGRALCRP